MVHFHSDPSRNFACSVPARCKGTAPQDLFRKTYHSGRSGSAGGYEITPVFVPYSGPNSWNSTRDSKVADQRCFCDSRSSRLLAPFVGAESHCRYREIEPLRQIMVSLTERRITAHWNSSCLQRRGDHRYDTVGLT
jgi:hypothetical protein